MRHERRSFYRLTVLVGLFLTSGCASLKPSASAYPPETGGGLKMSDQCAGVLGALGPAFYVLGEWLASTTACH